MQIIAQGADDVPVFKFFDPDTKCVIQVERRPEQSSTATLIRTCAKTARDTIGPGSDLDHRRAGPDAGGLR